ncbi:MAG: gliding motility-associated C-terminal domain-containing protein [Flavobacteriales bacterium]
MLFMISFMNVALGQNRDTQWLFGNHCWIDFTQDTPMDAGLGHFFGNEGTVSVADRFGNLLFSTNGAQIFDRNGQVMPNGNDLAGHVSSTQSALIVPQPGSTDDQLFYVFTVAAEAGKYDEEHTGLEYVIVDMSLNTGLGDVSQETIELVPNTGEKLHATWHQNNRDVWVVAHSMNSTDYHAFLITCNGLEDHVISPTGRSHNSTTYGEGCIGALKLSPNGEHIACVYNGAGINGQSLESHLEIGVFNSLTGEVTITQSISKTNEDSSSGYGVEFSPNSSKIYWCYNSSESNLFQYEIGVGDIEDSEYAYVGITEYPHPFSALQLGPDGKIYIARAFNGTQLSIIANPNEEGIGSNYIDEGIELSQACRFGLPNQWMFPYPTPDHTVETTVVSLCEESSVALKAPAHLESPLLWSTGQTGRSISISEINEYWVTTTECTHDTVFFQIEPQEFCLCELFMPDAFTPDGDGLNEAYGTTSWCEFPDFSLQIFDRDGHIIFSSKDKNQLWDGSINGWPCPTGIYNWKVTWINPYLDAEEKVISEFGHVNLVR